MNYTHRVIYQNFSYEIVLIKDEYLQLHRAVIEVEKKLVRNSSTQLIGTTFINSVTLDKVVYSRRNEQFISKHGLEVKLISKM